jgi:hypothetical protein
MVLPKADDLVSVSWALHLRFLPTSVYWCVSWTINCCYLAENLEIFTLVLSNSLRYQLELTQRLLPRKRGDHRKQVYKSLWNSLPTNLHEEESITERVSGCRARKKTDQINTLQRQVRSGRSTVDYLIDSFRIESLSKTTCHYRSGYYMH